MPLPPRRPKPQPVSVFDELGSARTVSKGEYDSVAGNSHRSRIAKAPLIRREYDLCMVFRYKTSRNVAFHETKEEMSWNARLKVPNEEAKKKMISWMEQRELTFKTMQYCGLRLLCFYNRDRDEIFCKVGASARKLKCIAARLRYRLELKPEYQGAYAEFRHDFPGTMALGCSDRRIVSHMYKIHTDEFEHYASEDAIFSTRDKIRLIDHIINAREKDCAGLGIGTMLHEQKVRSYFPLHENHLLHDLASKTWSWVMMPKDHATKVRDYFGEKVAFYFLFMSFYWKWLALPACVGMIVQLVDLFMRTPDNFTANVFCIVSAVSAVLLPHFWQREEAKFALAWGTFGLEPELDPPRSQHFGEPRLNPVTGVVEPFYPGYKRYNKYALSAVVLAFCAAFMTTVILGMLYARHQLKGQISGGIVTFQFLLAFIVECMNGALSVICRWLTNQENHRTQSDHERHMLAKVLGFKFINSYFVFFYTAFFKDNTALFGVPMHCIQDDCLLDLQAQLAVFTVVRLTLKNVGRFLYPRICAWLGRLLLNGQFSMFTEHWLLDWPHGRLELAELSNAEMQAKMEPYEPFADFDEALISHGYVFFFAVSCPWVCAATLLWAICELLLDMKDVTESRRRPFPVQVKSIAPWGIVFQAYGFIAAFTNMALLVFVSDQYASWQFAHKGVLFLYLMHAVLLVYIFAKAFFPETPGFVEVAYQRQEIVAQKCLENIKDNPNKEALQHLRSIRRDKAMDRAIEVYDQDPVEVPHGEEEPNLQWGESWSVLKKGLAENLSDLMVLALISALAIGVAFVILILCYHP